MLIYKKLGLGHAASVDQTGVVQSITKDDVPLPHHDGYYGQIGHIPRWESQAGLRSLKKGRDLFELHMDREVPRHQPRGLGARPKTKQGLLGTLQYFGVIGQTQIIIRAKKDAVLMIDRSPHSAQVIHHSQAAS